MVVAAGIAAAAAAQTDPSYSPDGAI